MAIKYIASAANPFYRALLRLSRDGRERREQALTVIDGVHLIEACLMSGETPRHVVVAEGAWSRQEIAALMRRLPAPPIIVTDRLFASLTELKSPSGILAVIAIPDVQPPIAPGFGILLEDVQDPGNLGSILRSSAAAGVSDAWLSAGCADAWSPKVLRAAMGAHFSLRLHQSADLLRIALRCPHRVIGLTLRAARPIFQLNLTGPVALALGNEGSGLSARLSEAATELATIPMPGRAESLNVAAAAAIGLFERVRQMSVAGSQALEIEQVLMPNRL